MKQIEVNTQKELDNTSVDFDGRIFILGKNIWVSKKYLCSVEARGNSSVVARENSSVVAWENSSVEARENSSVVARENSSVEAWGNSSVVALENSSVVARGNSSVVALENSSVVARENSSVEAWGNSSVVALENSSVVAWENSSVDLKGFSQAAIFSKNVKIASSQMGRFIYPNKDFETFALYHGITVKKNKAILYKAVDKSLKAFYDGEFQYEVGKKVLHAVDEDITRECSVGLHVSHLDLAIQFGKDKNQPFKILECEVDIDKIILPENSDGKVRTGELVVLREVPEEEWKTK